MASSQVDPEGWSLYWGDFHKHLTGPRRGRIATNLDRAGEIIEHASQHLDVYAPLCYPFEVYHVGRADGMGVETVGQRPRFLEWWEKIQAVTREHHQPNEFVTFPAYEWHGDRTRWGDHNVVYFEEGYPLDDASTIEELYDNLAERKAFAIPHHTAYDAGHRSKDWAVFDPAISPVMEIFSGQGSSEGINSPVEMATNPSMGPRTSGGTFIDGLERGHRVGVIASNDWTGLPGSWNSGLAGIWATELTREGIWDAIRSRRTFGVTGDRIRLWWSLNDQPMGSTVDESGPPFAAEVSVDCPQPLDCIELVHGGTVVYTHNHQLEPGVTDGRWKVLVEFGWGPDPRTEFDRFEQEWTGTLRLDDGELHDVLPRFSGFGQSYAIEGRSRCRFSLESSRSTTEDFPESRAAIRHHRQGLILDFDGRESSTIVLDLDGHEPIEYAVEDLRNQAHVVAFTDESERRIEAEFGVTRDQLRENRFAADMFYSNARKVKFHPAYAAAECSTHLTVDELPYDADSDYYYVRANQVNGQYAWSSPIWIEP